MFISKRMVNAIATCYEKVVVDPPTLSLIKTAKNDKRVMLKVNVALSNSLIYRDSFGLNSFVRYFITIKYQIFITILTGFKKQNPVYF